MKTSHQFLIYSVIGAIGTIGHYIILIFLVEFTRTGPVFATTAGFVVGALINYILNYRITFSSDKRHREAIVKFLIVAILGAAANAMIMSVGVNIFDAHYLVIQVVATCIVLSLNFTANKFWTFA